jgi:multidrug transporter EmrE-like cation transporter
MPRLLDLCLYAGSAVLTAIGLTLIKQQVGLRFDGGVVEALKSIDVLALAVLAGAVAIYLAGLGLWLIAMGRNPLSTAYPLGIGSALVLSTLSAIVIVGETPSVAEIVGLILIVAGGTCISRAK